MPSTRLGLPRNSGMYYLIVYFKYNVFIFRVYVALTESGPWTEVLEAELEDSRQQEDPLPLQLISLESEVLAQFVKFEVLKCWGKGCGLQYFDIQRNRFAI